MSQSARHPANLDDEKLLAECQVRRTKRSGPGGQHRNKVESAIVIAHQPSGVKAEASERRSQHENRRVALFRLRANLALNVRVHREPEQTPSELWQTRCRDGRILVNPSHTDFPLLLAEALDVLNYQDWDLKQAAEIMNCTVSQFVKFLKLDWRAYELARSRRTPNANDEI